MVCNMLQKLKGTPVIRLHTWAFYLLCGFGLFSSVSTTVTSIFLSLLTALLLFRLWVKHDDWQDALPDGQLCLALLLLMVAVVLSSFFPAISCIVCAYSVISMERVRSDYLLSY